MEARVAKLEALTEMTNTSLGRIESRIDRLEGRIDGMDGRLRAVEQRLAEISGKIDVLIGSVVGKLPTWWQMPAVIGSTVALLVLLYAGVRYLQSHGLL